MCVNQGKSLVNPEGPLFHRDAETFVTYFRWLLKRADSQALILTLP
jgi:hypothetical protein